MLYHTNAQCQCGCHQHGSNCCVLCMVEDGVEPIGAIDWYDPAWYGWLSNCRPDLAEQYRVKWENAYKARGWKV